VGFGKTCLLGNPIGIDPNGVLQDGHVVECRVSNHLRQDGMRGRKGSIRFTGNGYKVDNHVGIA